MAWAVTLAANRAPIKNGEPLDVPPYAEDGGEEGEIVGVYLVGPDGMPHRLGMTIGNEFSDHVFERHRVQCSTSQQLNYYQWKHS